MKQETVPSRSVFIVILLTLLIHALLLLFVCMSPHALFLNQTLAQKLAQLESTVHPHQQPPPPQQHPWVTVQQLQSPMGAPVVLVESADPDMPTDKTADTPAPQKDPQDTPAAPDPAPLEHPTDTKAQEVVKQEETAPHDIPVAPITKKEKMRTSQYDPNYIPSSLFKKKPTETRQKPGSSTPKKKQMDLAQLTKEFDAQTQLRHAGPTMIGTSNSAKMTEQQLKEGQYTAKIIQSIQSTWRVHRTECPSQAPRMVPIHFMLTIARNGTITDVTILKTTGSRPVDQFIIDVMRDTGTSMPPIPGWMNTDTYQLECTGKLNPHVGPENIIIIRR